MSLKDIVCSADTRPRIVKDATRLVQEEVDAKSGLSGIAIKTAYKAVTKIKPGLIEDVVDNLLDRFVDRLEPFFKSWEEGGRKEPFDGFLTSRKSEVANALLAVTDERARKTSHQTLRKSYEALRPQGEKNVIAAVPGLARLMVRYVK
ncbi:MAG: hypothetical protein HYV07_27930 [Deltaproteobacteria bacterium]|nr:hypothetical protein [Deltaproteobacteria bacterium]